MEDSRLSRKGPLEGILGRSRVEPTVSQLDDPMKMESSLCFSLLDCKVGMMIPISTRLLISLRNAYENALLTLELHRWGVCMFMSVLLLFVPGAVCVSHFLKSNFYNFLFKHIMSRIYKIKLLFSLMCCLVNSVWARKI